MEYGGAWREALCIEALCVSFMYGDIETVVQLVFYVCEWTVASRVAARGLWSIAPDFWAWGAGNGEWGRALVG